MALTPSLLFGRVMHKRTLPKVNAFSYGIYYLAIPLSQIDALPLPVNHFGPLSFYAKDHGARDGGARDGSNLESWARSILDQYGVKGVDGEIVLIALPRVLGYVFNPVSFWLMYDKKGKIRAVLCEVNNTFGETHSYLCAHEDHREITPGDIFEGDKVFHVSPFLKREGHYSFRFDLSEERCGLRINYYDAQGNPQLLTSLSGDFAPLTVQTLRKAFWAYPLVTLKAIGLIHWQALKLCVKGIKYIAKPEQLPIRVTSVQKNT